MSKDAKQILDLIHKLMNQSFEGWSDKAIGGYTTAMKTIEGKAIELSGLTKVELIRSNIINRIHTEEALEDCPMVEAMYDIRKLKALAQSLEVGYIWVEEKDGGIYSEEFDIYFQDDQYVRTGD
jgi:hypothetical protein